MRSPHLDHWLNLVDRPAFLAALGPHDREFGRVVGLPLLAVAAAAVIGGVAFVLVMPLNGLLLHWFSPGSASAPITGVTLHRLDAAVGLVGETARLLTTAPGFIGLCVAVPLVGALLMRRPARSWFTGALQFRWRLMVSGFGLYAAITAAGMALEGLVAGFPKSPPLFQSDESFAVRGLYLLATVAVLAAAAAAEELVFRGWMMQQTAAFTRSLPLIVGVNAVLFAAMHLDSDPAQNLVRFTAGVVYGLVALRLGGLEFGIGLHAANNVMIALFLHPLAETAVTSRMGLGELMVQMGVSLSGLVLAELVSRQPRLRFWAGLAEPDR
jgi:membrane protease YdiL (CAAX protease family)